MIDDREMLLIDGPFDGYRSPVRFVPAGAPTTIYVRAELPCGPACEGVHFYEEPPGELYRLTRATPDAAYYQYGRTNDAGRRQAEEIERMGRGLRPVAA